MLLRDLQVTKSYLLLNYLHYIYTIYHNKKDIPKGMPEHISLIQIYLLLGIIPPELHICGV